MVFNAGLGVTWKANKKELRFFTSVNELVERLQKHGFKDTNKRLLQEHDPSRNTLMEFIKS